MVAKLLLARKSQRQIADAIGATKSTIARDAIAIRHEWQAQRIDAQETATAEELARLSAAEEAIWPKIIAGDLLAIDRLLRIMERRAKLLGLDAPKRIDITSRLLDLARHAGLDENDAQEAVREASRLVAEAQ